MGLTLAPLFSGSDGNATYVASDKAAILIDAGKSMRQIEQEMAKAGVCPVDLAGILVTHEHSDHIKAVGSLSRKYNIPIYANAGTWEAMEDMRRKGKKPDIGEISLRNTRVITEDDFYIKDLCIQPYRTSHDAACSFGYAVQSGGSQISIMTDLGYVSERILETAAGSAIVLLESNYDEQMLADCRYPQWTKRRIASRVGHLSNEDSGRVAAALVARGVRGILLSHISVNSNTHSLALETVEASLRERNIIRGRHVALDVCRRGELTGVYHV